MAHTALTLLLTVGGLTSIRSTLAALCTPTDSNPTAVAVSGKFGQSLTITGEMQGEVLLAQWTRIFVGPDNTAKEVTLVTNANGVNKWPDNSTDRLYTASYKVEGGKVSYALQYMKMGCFERGEFTCTFTTISGRCVNKFNVNITADPRAPTLKNDTIRGDAGSTVHVVCEANVGYPPGVIWWYYYPADGSPYRLQSDPLELSTSQGDCRYYGRSTISIVLKTEDNYNKIRCTSRTSTGQIIDHSEAPIIINGMERTTTTTPRPCVGSDCASTGAVDIKASLLTSIFAAFLLVLLLSRYREFS